MDYFKQIKQFRKDLDEALKSVKSVSITSHKNPDPDAFCSAIALKIYIDKYFPGVKTDIVFEWKKVEEGILPEWMEKIIWVDDLSAELMKYEINIFTDGSQNHRFTSAPEKLSFEDKNVFCIDHHSDEPDKYTFAVVNPDKSSCAEMVSEIFFTEKDFRDKELAQILLLGILADTGSFKYLDSKHSSALIKTSEILSVSNVNLQVLHQILSTVSQSVYEIFQELVNNTKFIELPNCKHGIMYTYISNETQKKYGDNDVKLAKNNYLFGSHRNVEGHQWGFIVTPFTTGESKYTLSFRSTPRVINVVPIANLFNGGGHKMAAGGDIKKDPSQFSSEQIVEEVLEELKKFDFSVAYLD